MLQLLSRATGIVAKAQARYKQQYDARVIEKKMTEVGNFLYLRRHLNTREPENPGEEMSRKLRRRLGGPFKILDCNPQNPTVLIENKVLKECLHLHNLVLRRSRPPPETIDDEFVIENIVCHTERIAQEREYKIRWMGYAP